MLRRERETATKVAQTKAALALHQLALDHQADDAAAHGTMAETGEGWREQSMARFDARAVPLLAALPPELKAEFAPQLAKLPDHQIAASEAAQASRRTSWARNAADTLRQAGLSRIAADPDSWAAEHAICAGYAAGLPLPHHERTVLANDSHFRSSAAEALIAVGRDADALAVLRDRDGSLDPSIKAAVTTLMLTRDAKSRA